MKPLFRFLQTPIYKYLLKTATDLTNYLSDVTITIRLKVAGMESRWWGKDVKKKRCF